MAGSTPSAHILPSCSHRTHRICRRVHSFSRSWSVCSGLRLSGCCSAVFIASDPILTPAVDVRARAWSSSSACAMLFGAAPLAFSDPAGAARSDSSSATSSTLRYRLTILHRGGRGGDSHMAHRSSARAFGRVVRAGVQNPDDGRRARHLAGALYDGDRCSRRGTCRSCRRAACARSSGVHPAMGAEILTAAFVVVVIGGLGSFWGVIAAALLVGVVRGVTIYFNPSWRRSFDVSADGSWCCCCDRAGSSASASRNSNRRCIPQGQLPLWSLLRSRSCFCRSCSYARWSAAASPRSTWSFFAIACMGLNILVGYTGLVSFGHGAWFGLGAYAAAHQCSGSGLRVAFFLPDAFAIAVRRGASLAFRRH